MAKNPLSWIIPFVRKMRQGASKKSDQDHQSRNISPEAAGDSKTDVQPSNYERLSVCKEDREHENLRLEHERLSKQLTQLQTEIEELSSDKQALEHAVNIRESQILVLRPYRAQFTRSDAQSDLKVLLDNISSWVEEWTDGLAFDAEFSRHWMDSLKCFPRIVVELRRLLDFNPDLLSAVGYAEMDQHLISACIVRFIRQKIFEEIPCSIPPQTAEMLHHIEHIMPLCSAPELDKSTISSWRAQAYHTIFSHPQYLEARQTGIDTLSADLAHIFGFLSNSYDNAEFIRSIASKIIEPSLSLYENFRRNEEEYYFETADCLKPGTRMSQDLPEGRLQELLRELECRNAMKFNAPLQADLQKEKPTDEELQNHLYFICSISPALKVRGIRGNYGEEPVTLLKEKVLVAWDRDNLTGGDLRKVKSQTWLSRICSN